MGCDADACLGKHFIGISIHAPRVGCDATEQEIRQHNQRFQSTHPVWGATKFMEEPVWGFEDFNPRTPCGVRPLAELLKENMAGISIHAPRVGCD